MPTNSWNDLMGSAESAGQAIPDGLYDVVVESAKKAKTSNQKDMVVAVFKVINGPYTGSTVWNNFVISTDNPNALGFFFEHMATLGATSDFFAQIPPPPEGLDYVANKIIGTHATITVSSREWGGSMRNQVDAVKPYAGSVAVAPAPGVPVAPAPAVGAQPPAQQVMPVPQAPVPVAPAVSPAAPVPGGVPTAPVGTPAPAPEPVTAPVPEVATPPVAPPTQVPEQAQVPPPPF
jgi:hypothetical protein